MRDKKKHFLDFMHIECQGLREDIEFLIEEAKQKLDTQKITERVFLENTTLFQNELLGIEEFLGILLSTDSESFETLDDMIEHLKSTFAIRLKSEALAEAVQICIERKLQKVVKYMKED